MATITNFEDLEIWQEARKFAQDICKTQTDSESFFKDYKLKEQINRSNGSITDNNAEGFEPKGRNEFIRFLSIAKDSVGEAKSQHRVFDRNYIREDLFDRLNIPADGPGKKIGGFINYLKKS